MSRSRDDRRLWRRRGRTRAKRRERSVSMEKLEERAAPGACLMSAGLVGAAAVAHPTGPEQPGRIHREQMDANPEPHPADPPTWSILGEDSEAALPGGRELLLDDLFEPREEDGLGWGGR